MNDLKENAKFSFGKVELGVIPDEADIKKMSKNAHADRVNTALCNKMDAVDALDAFRHTLVSNLSKAQKQNSAANRATNRKVEQND